MTVKQWFIAWLLLAVTPLSANAQNEAGPFAALGIMVGEVTDNSANVQVRLTSTQQPVNGDVPGAPGSIVFELIQVGDGRLVQRQAMAAQGSHDYIARATFHSLQPGQGYQCRTLLSSAGRSVAGPVATFRTLPGADKSADVRFVVVTGMNYAKFHGDDRIDRQIHKIQNNTELPKPYDGTDKHLGYPGLESIRKLKPDFFVGTGDNVYYDTPKEPRARTITEMRQKWHEQFVQPRYRNLFATVPTYWMMDDHDFRVDDADNSGDYRPLPRLGQRVFLEQLPIAEQGNAAARTFRTHRISRDLQIWFTENRLYRSDNKTPDGPHKTIWGPEQKAWLMRTLATSDATFKLLISPTPMIGPDDKRKTDNHTNVGGFQHERDEFFAWLGKTGIGKQNFYLVCGDRHWQYHARHPLGIEEFSCGALVDANSRLGRKPGDPDSTDPEATIQQLYAQDVRSGGFLQIKLMTGDSPKLVFVWHDEYGKVLHQHEKTPRP